MGVLAVIKSTKGGSVDTGYSMVIDQRLAKPDSEEISSFKQRKWKRMARARGAQSEMREGGQSTGKRVLLFDDEVGPDFGLVL
ncbi:hypothetical protein ACOSQ4_026726 [Xanthoceras sorbifolium]